VRFSRATAAHLVACPLCGEPPQTGSAEAVFGFPLLVDDDLAAPDAVEVALPPPPPLTVFT
jgi:hypothetical protein